MMILVGEGMSPRVSAAPYITRVAGAAIGSMRYEWSAANCVSG